MKGDVMHNRMVKGGSQHAWLGDRVKEMVISVLMVETLVTTMSNHQQVIKKNWRNNSFATWTSPSFLCLSSLSAKKPPSLPLLWNHPVREDGGFRPERVPPSSLTKQTRKTETLTPHRVLSLIQIHHQFSLNPSYTTRTTSPNQNSTSILTKTQTLPYKP